MSVHDDILNRIASGEFADTFPGEIQLTTEYQVSRSTLRLALNPLRREGLVSASRGKRPMVHVNHGEEHRFGPVYSLFAAVEASGMRQRSELIRREIRVDARIADRLDLPGDASLVKKDTSIVVPGRTLTVDVDADNPGRWFTYCPDPYHGEAGMMGVLAYLK
ncbi:GntR family transcriptional regulator [Cryobacterium sp. M91]|uniref:GntR family transcriptional regulator n=1 Tax=Cryobacterium sp. M91 TaxID=2048294 RepID=UPI001304ADCE|nr:GntR family transcriptional regulator [Cryobacterium sp. M91]